MLTVAVFYLLGFGSHAAVPADSVDFTPTARTVIVFVPSSRVVDSLNQDAGFQKAYSDFNDRLGNVVGYLREKDVAIKEATGHLIRIHSRKGAIDRVLQGNFTDVKGQSHLFGLIVVEPKRSPLVIFGVDTSDKYLLAIEEYYHVR